MADYIVDLLDKNYDAEHGVVNVRPVVDMLLSSSKDPYGPFAQVSQAFGDVEPRWHLPILEAMRVLAASGHCTQKHADEIFRATDTVAAESGNDEYFKSVNALVVSPKTAPALPEHIRRWLNTDREFDRRLAFYTSGMLVDRKMNELLKNLRAKLESAANAEPSPKLKGQFMELLTRL